MYNLYNDHLDEALTTNMDDTITLIHGDESGPIVITKGVLSLIHKCDVSDLPHLHVGDDVCMFQHQVFGYIEDFDCDTYGLGCDTTPKVASAYTVMVTVENQPQYPMGHHSPITTKVKSHLMG